MSSISRRTLLRLSVAGLAPVESLALPSADASAAAQEPKTPRPYLTPGDDFNDVSRGDPVPHSLTGEALVKAGLTAESWRLEIEAEGKARIERPRRKSDGTSVDLPALLELGRSKGLMFLKAMQCNNIAYPLGQGLWEGVPLRDVLALAGGMTDVRRVYYWGFHNDDDEQMFRSSLAINQALDTPPGELPPFLAYRLNGQPIPLERGGPVRLIVPWAHGFKSVKWLQKIVVTNDYKANDTYALANNDPESYLKTAAYLDDAEPSTLDSGDALIVTGTAMVGWPGLDRVEYWLRPAPSKDEPLDPNDPAWASADWKPCRLDAPPSDLSAELPDGTDVSRIWGFGPDGRPKEWPMRFSVARWSADLGRLEPGAYEFRARSVDRNGFAQPEPRSFEQRSGMNGVQCKRLTIGS